MTDNEIKKALECCASHTLLNRACDDCPYGNRVFKGARFCNSVLSENALDLINRLEAEASNYYNVAKNQQSVSMERYFEIKRLKEELIEKSAEIERLQNKVKELADVLSNSIRIRYAEAKAEAVKEFAARLKDKAQRFHNLGINNNGYVFVVEQSNIDNLVKEMVGE